MHIFIIGPDVPYPLPQIPTMKQRGLHNDSRNRCKRETIRQGECSREKQRRVGLVGIQTQSEIRRQDVCDIVKVPSVVIRLRVADWEIIAVPSIRVVDPNCSDPPEYDHTYHRIGYCVPRWNERTIGVCANLSPVKGDWQQRNSSPSAK